MSWGSISYPRVVLGALIVAVSLTVGVSAGTSPAGFSTYNPAWDGTSEIRPTASAVGTEPVIVRNTTAYQHHSANESVAMVFSPATAYSDRDLRRIRSFVRSGGTVVVADDYRTQSNRLLAGIGADARITGTPLRDERRTGPSPAFPRVYAATNHTFTESARVLMLNHGSTVQANGATTLFHSSEFSYQDRNRDGTLNQDEELTRYPVVTVESVGAGRVLVVSDGSIFLNSMLDRTDNAAFLRTLVGSGEYVLIDVSHTPGVPPLVSVQLFLQQSSRAAFVVGTLSIFGIVLLPQLTSIGTRLMAFWGRQSSQQPRLSREELANGISAQHPEWDEERVARVTDSLMRRRQQGERND